MLALFLPPPDPIERTFRVGFADEDMFGRIPAVEATCRVPSCDTEGYVEAIPDLVMAAREIAAEAVIVASGREYEGDTERRVAVGGLSRRLRAVSFTPLDPRPARAFTVAGRSADGDELQADVEAATPEDAEFLLRQELARIEGCDPATDLSSFLSATLDAEAQALPRSDRAGPLVAALRDLVAEASAAGCDGPALAVARRLLAAEAAEVA